MKSLLEPWSVDIFKFGTTLTKNLLKHSTTAWSSEIIFSETISYWLSWETTFFSISVILDFVFILSIKGFVICDVTCINITKEIFLFIPNQAYTEIMLFIICLSINVTFVFITVNVSLRKSDNLFSTVTEFWKLFGLFVINRLMQEVFKRFFKQVFSLIRILQLRFQRNL